MDRKILTKNSSCPADFGTFIRVEFQSLSRFGFLMQFWRSRPRLVKSIKTFLCSRTRFSCTWLEEFDVCKVIFRENYIRTRFFMSYEAAIKRAGISNPLKNHRALGSCSNNFFPLGSVYGFTRESQKNSKTKIYLFSLALN